MVLDAISEARRASEGFRRLPRSSGRLRQALARSGVILQWIYSVFGSRALFFCWFCAVFVYLLLFCDVSGRFLKCFSVFFSVSFLIKNVPAKQSK